MEGGNEHENHAALVELVYSTYNVAALTYRMKAVHVYPSTYEMFK